MKDIGTFIRPRRPGLGLLINWVVDMAPPKTPNAKRGTMHGAAAQNLAKFTIRAAPLPAPILEFLLDNLAILRRMQQERKEGEGDSSNADEEEGAGDEDYDVQGEYIKKPTIKAEAFWPSLQEKCKEVGGEWADIVEKIWAFGPQRMGTCLLIDARQGQPNS